MYASVSATGYVTASPLQSALEGAVPVWITAGALVSVLVLSWLFGGAARMMLRGRARLNTTTSMVVAILGTAVGFILAGIIDPTLHVWSGVSVALGVVSAVSAVAVYGLVAARFQHTERASVAELLAAGESDRVEFKSTARINMRSGEKDPRMELIIVKTVSAFLNADGGTLLIGVDDAGTPLGLDADFATLKVPDADRFELWLRDLFTTALGQNAAAAIGVAVETVRAAGGPAPVCRVTCSPSPRPVYLRTGKSTPPEFWLRTGNSTRQLSVDQAAEYIMHRWPLGIGSAAAAQVRAAVRFSTDR
ncbi:AlbA family DNA-binding domain-containing protein [Gordonia rhizosphera]|uniref:AlbA family DNA-binding domain-containing protein n=1 Tax=Gordonia rhizosphera TaxID=83341 RepID=UPI001FDEFF4D|nr:ATP-binding protein [Gordonia rhizosphera]